MAYKNIYFKISLASCSFRDRHVYTDRQRDKPTNKARSTQLVVLLSSTCHIHLHKTNGSSALKSTVFWVVPRYFIVYTTPLSLLLVTVKCKRASKLSPSWAQLDEEDEAITGKSYSMFIDEHKHTHTQAHKHKHSNSHTPTHIKSCACFGVAAG